MSRSILISQDVTGFVSTEPPGPTPGARDGRVSARELELLRRETLAQAEKKLNDELERQRKLWTALETSFRKFQDSIEQAISDQLIDLAVKIAEIIIRRELPDRAMIRDIVRETLEPLADLHGVRVRVSPDDAKLIMAARQGGETEDVSDLVEVVADRSLGSGDVLIESRNGYFNAQITERLELLKTKLRERYRDAHADNS